GTVVAGLSEGGSDRRFSDADGARTTGPGDGVDLSAGGDHGSVSRRAALEAGADCGDDRGVAGPDRVDEGFEVVSEGTADELYQPGRGQAGVGVSSEPVADCGGIGWNLRQQPGIADASGVSSSAADRLHFRRVCRGTWVCRSSGGSAVILYSADAVDPKCANGARPRRSIFGNGCGGCA